MTVSAAEKSDQDTTIALEDLPWQLHFVQGEARGSKGKADGTELPSSFTSNEGWSPVRVGVSWYEQGVAWYRTRFTIPASWQGQALVLNLGRPDDGAEVFLNGKRLGAVTRFGELLRFRLKPEEVKTGEDNFLAVRVWNWYQAGGLNFGQFSIERYGPAVQQPVNATPASLPLKLTDSLNDDVMKTPGFGWGWRDAGTSDTRPKLSPARGALNGKDALAMRVDRPGSTEYFDVALTPDRGGAAWRRSRAVALRFWIRSDDTEGEIQLRLNQGPYRWGGGAAQSFMSRVSFKAGSGWQQVTVPLAAFKRMVRDANFEPLMDVGPIDNISIGYGNNELHRPGTILLGGFEVVPASLAPAATPIDLSGLWKYSLDNARPDGSASVFDEKNPAATRDRLGYGVDKGWAAPSFDAKSWAEASLPGNLWSQGVTYHGPVWFRREVLVPAEWAGQDLRLDVGKPDDMAEVFFNGQSVCKTGKSGDRLVADVTADKVRAGQVNVVAVRVIDWNRLVGLNGPLSLRLKVAELGVKWVGAAGNSVAPEDFEMGARPGKPIELALKFGGKLAAATDTQISYQLNDCFYHEIAAGQVKSVRNADGTPGCTLSLTPEQSRQLYYGEWFSLKATLGTSKGEVVACESWDEVKLKYAERDTLALAELPAQALEATPYGALKLVDVINAAADPAADVHPYKEGGIRAGWVGRRAYSPWINGVTVEQHANRGYREVNNNQFFGYRVGRGKLKAHTAYLLRVLVPDNKRRYFVMDIQAGRNYKGTGYFNGSSADDPNGNYPTTGEYQWYDHIVMNDDITYGSHGSRSVSSENGFWVFFHDNGRVYTGQYEAGPAVAEIRLYELGDSQYPEIRFPEGAPRRVMMMDWEREPEAPPADAARYARLMGFTHIAPTIQKWAFGGYWRNDLGFVPPSWHRVSREGEQDEDIYDKWLTETAGMGVALVPRVEYGGGPNLPQSAKSIGPDGKTGAVGRYATWGANILAPETWDELSRVIDQLVVTPHQKYPQVAGMLWRQRQERIRPSYGVKDVELFCRETGRAMPTGTPAEIARWASQTVSQAYHDWWQIKRADLIRKVRDRVKSQDPALKLFYYPYDEDGWSLGPQNNSHNSREDWSDLYDVKTAGDFWRRRLAQLRAIPPQKFAEQVRTFPQPHMRFLPELFARDADLYIFAPVCRQYLANNADYVNYFRTGAGLSVSHIFSYEEKGRNNVQGDSYESSEMTPGGRNFAMADEVQAFFHGDPVAITCTTYTYGRGWALEHREFAQAFLALPAVPGTIVPQQNAGDDIRLRTYDAAGRRYISLVNRGITERAIEVTVPGKGSVADLVTGQTLQTRVEQGAVHFTAHLQPMSLNSFCLQP